MIQRYSSGSAFEQTFGYSRAVAIPNGDWLEILVSGCSGFDYSTMTLPEGVEAQTRQAFANVAAALAKAGAGLEHLVRVRIYLADGGDFDTIAPIVGDHCRAAMPANTSIVAKLLDPKMKIEIEVDARLPRKA